jgi:UDP-N-acetylmuramate dehydrogenase
MPVQVMGGGSNLIFSDEGFSGLVMKIGLQGVRFEDRGEECVVGVQAGQDWDRLVQASVERGLGGIECLSGIPGLVGATPMQNVGAYGQEVEDVITVVRALERETLQMVEFERQACGFAYRQSRFKNEDLGRYIIVEVEYCLKKEARPQLHYAELQRYVEEKVDIEGLESGAALQAVRQAVLELRRGKSMVVDAADPNARSAGSFFLNPVVSKQQFGAIEERWAAMGGEGAVPSFDAAEGVKVPAAWLVERAGFAKGYRRGGIGVSEKHALALVNWGGTTRELLQLAEQICRGVEEKFGVRLEREPVVVEWES